MSPPQRVARPSPSAGERDAAGVGGAAVRYRTGRGGRAVTSAEAAGWGRRGGGAGALPPPGLGAALLLPPPPPGQPLAPLPAVAARPRLDF